MDTQENRENRPAEIVRRYRDREGRTNLWIISRLPRDVRVGLTPQMFSDSLHGRRPRLYKRLRPYIEAVTGLELPPEG